MSILTPELQSQFDALTGNVTLPTFDIRSGIIDYPSPGPIETESEGTDKNPYDDAYFDMEPMEEPYCSEPAEKSKPSARAEGTNSPQADVTEFVSNLDENDPIPEREKIAGLFTTGFLSCIYSQAGIGKTFLTEKIICDLSMGRDILSGYAYAERAYKSLVLAGEAGKETLVKRLRATKWQHDKNNIAVFNSLEAACKGIFITLNSLEGQKLFSKLLDTYKPDIVFIDTLCSFHEVDENKAIEMKPILQFLAREASMRGIAIVACHHERKRDTKTRGTSEAHQDDMIGSSIMGRLVGLNLSLKLKVNDDGVEEVFVKSVKCWDRKPNPFSFTIGENPETGRVDLLINLLPENSSPVKKALRLEKQSVKLFLLEKHSKPLILKS